MPGATAAPSNYAPKVIRSLSTEGDEPLVPAYWAPQDTNCLVVDVPVDSSEWRSVSQRFHTSLKQSRYHVIRVQRVQVRVHRRQGP